MADNGKTGYTLGSILFLLIHHTRAPEEQAELNQMMIELMEADREREEGRKMARTSAQVLEARGRKEGRKEGKIEGKMEGQSEMLLDLLTTKSGPLSAEVVAAVTGMLERRLRELARQILAATTLQEMGLPE